MAHPYVTGASVGKEVCKALGLDYKSVHRIILDLSYDGVAKAYVEMVGDSRLLNIQWTDVLKGAGVITTKEAIEQETL